MAVIQGQQGILGEDVEQMRMFKLFKRKYVYSSSQGTYVPLDPMPAHLPHQIASALQNLRLINTQGALIVSFLLLLLCCC